VTAIDAQRGALVRKPEKPMRFGPTVVSQRAYAKALDRLATELRSRSTTEEKLAYIQYHFDFYETYGRESWGEILLTSYFEPVIRGSHSRTKAFSQPLYARPKDLLTVPLAPFSQRFQGEGSLKGRVQQDRVMPYFSREEIDGGGALKGRGLELAWVDPIDAFFLQIQGSGTINFGGSAREHLVYADKNGHAYVPVGKFLKEKIAPNPVTMQAIVDELKNMSPRERDALLFKNPSYVFFARSKQRAVTSLGVPATPGRTVAADPAFSPKGALAFVSFSKPTFSHAEPSDTVPASSEEVGRFVLDQDSGGAITGTGRIDLFWGRGENAGRYAGALQDSARIWYLVPKDLGEPVPDNPGQP
jgi:membrane-bound lytic murein transglycosylase A